MFPANPPEDVCINCAAQLTGTFCSNCGQRANTKRFSIKTLWDGQFLEDVFQLNRGLAKTLKDLLYRPGRVAIEYISGHRKRYFNFFTLLLLLLTVDIVLRGYSPLDLEGILKHRFGTQISLNEGSDSLKLVIVQFYKLAVFFMLFWVTLIQWLLLRRMKLNVWEHFVAATFLISSQTLISVIGGILPAFHVPNALVGNLYDIVSNLTVVYTLLFYFQLTKGVYPTILGRIWRVILLWWLASIFIAGSIALLIGFLDGASGY